jgi:hypothetical protein
MYMILRYANGRREEAVLLRATRERMKVIVRDREDTLELNLIGTQWISESGSAVEIESIISGDAANEAIVADEMRHLVAYAVS